MQSMLKGILKSVYCSSLKLSILYTLELKYGNPKFGSHSRTSPLLRYKKIEISSILWLKMISLDSTSPWFYKFGHAR